MGHTVRIGEGAPIAQALAMRFNQMEAEITSAEAGDERIDVALNGMLNFLSALVQAVHQLETGEAPPVTGFSDSNLIE